MIIDNDQPTFVIVDYKVYRNMIAGEENSLRPNLNFADQRISQSSNLGAQELEIIERLNKEILALKNQIESEERAELESQESD